MPTTRLKSSLWVKAIIRQFNKDSVEAVLIKKGDDDAGALLIILTDPDNNYAILREQNASWHRPTFKRDPTLPAFEQIESYIKKQKNIDPDLWIIEINVLNCHSPIEKKLTNRYISQNAF